MTQGKPQANILWQLSASQTALVYKEQQATGDKTADGLVVQGIIDDHCSLMLVIQVGLL